MRFPFWLKVTLLILLAGEAWNVSQNLVYIAVSELYPFPPHQDDLSKGPFLVRSTVINISTGIMGPLVAFTVLYLLIPKCSFCAKARIIALFTFLCVITSIAFNYSPVLSMGRTPGIFFDAEIGGTLSGALLVFLALRFKTAELSKPPISNP